VYVQELKHDAEVDGIRFTIPTSISPRYGSYPGQLMDASSLNASKGISIIVDIDMAVPIKKLVSPSHHIEVSLGAISTDTIDQDSSFSKASATLALGTTELEKDFVLQIAANDIGIPQAILETHPTLANQRALMTTLVPKFNLKSKKPEIVFIADRSGSMQGNIPTLVSALNVFLKSIPIGCWFNICSFGSRHEFLWSKSKLYSQDTLSEAINYVNMFGSDFGGTETLQAVKATIENRLTEMNTELVLLTDGDIWHQEEMFKYVAGETTSGGVRVFPIGIGGGVSSALIEGVARAGRGFAQMVGNGEKLEGKIVRMLKGALSPHITDYQLEIQYEDGSVDSVAESLQLRLSFDEVEDGKYPPDNKPISLYDADAKEEHPKASDSTDPFAGLPMLDQPKVLQTPTEIPPLFPFNRTCVYLLMSPEASHLVPKSVILKGTSLEGPLKLEIPVQVRKGTDTMIHQLAARKAIQELEEGRGWVSNAKTKDDVLIKSKYPARLELLQRREAVRLGVEFQVGGKYCSFVAVEANEKEISEKRKLALEKVTSKNPTTGNDDNDSEDWEMVELEQKQAVRTGEFDSFVTCSASPFLSTAREMSFEGNDGEFYDVTGGDYLRAKASASGRQLALLGDGRGGSCSTAVVSGPVTPTDVYKYRELSKFVLKADARRAVRPAGESGRFAMFDGASDKHHSTNLGYNPTSPGFEANSPAYDPVSPVYSPTGPGYSPTSPESEANSPAYAPANQILRSYSSSKSSTMKFEGYGLNLANSEDSTGTRPSRTNQPPRKSTGGMPPRMQLASMSASNTKQSMFIDVEAEVDDEKEDEESEEINPDDLLKPAQQKATKKRKMRANVECTEEAKEEAVISDVNMRCSSFEGDSPGLIALKFGSKKKEKRSFNPKEKKTPAKEEGTVLERLIQRQSFEGPWTRESLLCDAMGISRDTVQTSVLELTTATGFDEEKIATVLATAIVVLFLEKKLASEEDTWELIVEKARDWLNDAVTNEVLARIWTEAESIVPIS
jgi:hypothetical protein